MLFEDYNWHYDYVRLAWDTGFSFERYKSPNIDANKICIVDVDRIVKETDVASVDRNIPMVIQYILDQDQAKVLDANFVKMFRMSQLAVEYLTFCKKYLDNTVVLLKKELAKSKKDIQELKDFNNGLQDQISTILGQKAFSTFKCSVCSKIFSSEAYLNSHINRRHSDQTANSETDKLNSEIKQLKERLNKAEKLFKEKEDRIGEGGKEENSSDVYRVFEKFKEQIDNELKELCCEKNHGKLFNIVINNQENVDPKQDVSKMETTTQTDKDKTWHIEGTKRTNLEQIKELSASNLNSPNLENIKDTFEQNISTTLNNIQSQMQAFWNKLNEIEKNKISQQNNVVVAEQEVKPKIKPRSRFSQPNENYRRNSKDASEIKRAIEEMERKQPVEKVDEVGVPKITNIVPKKEDVVENENNGQNKPETSEDESVSDKTNIEDPKDVKIPIEEIETHQITEVSIPKIANIRQRENNVQNIALTSDDATISDISSSDSEIPVKKLESSQNYTRKKSPGPIMDKDFTKSVNDVALSNEIMDSLNKEIQDVISSRIQELGISDSWKGLPERTFNKALEIINHQADLTKKAHPNFDHLKRQIEDDVQNMCKKNISGKINPRVSPKKKIRKAKHVINVAYRLKNNRQSEIRDLKPSRDIVEIKNRSLYDTDTDSEKNIRPPVDKIVSVSTGRELKPSPKFEIPKEKNQEGLFKTDQQKGVLKSYPSAGSLSKKRVFFDLESKDEEVPVIEKFGGSTTSVASSILEDKFEHEINAKQSNVQDISDLSDLDLSDL